MSYLAPVKKESTGGIPVFQSVIETAQGGFSLDMTGLAAGVIIPAGSVVSANESTRKAKIVKTATMQDVAANNATTYKVNKNHIIAVGDYIARSVGGTAYAVTDVDTSNADYDVLTVGTTLGVALVAGDAIFVSTATGATAAAHPAVSGLLYEDEEAQTDNPLSAVIRGTVYERRVPGAIATMKASLPTLVFSKSF
jgi:hypothetical protein